MVDSIGSAQLAVAPVVAPSARPNENTQPASLPAPAPAPAATDQVEISTQAAEQQQQLQAQQQQQAQEKAEYAASPSIIGESVYKGVDGKFIERIVKDGKVSYQPKDEPVLGSDGSGDGVQPLINIVT